MNKNNPPEKIFLIHGNQQLLIEEKIQNLKKNILDGRKSEWCAERFDIEEILKYTKSSGNSYMDDFLVSIETFPMLSDIKIIQIDNFDLIKKSAKKNDTYYLDRLYETIINIIKKPPDCLWVIFVSKATKEKDFSKNLYKLIREKWRIYKFVAYENNSPLEWIQQRAIKKRFPMSEKVARFFIDTIGNDLSDLDHELEKMSIYFSGEDINEQILLKNIRGHKHFSIFLMTEFLSNKQLLPALEILDTQFKTTPNEHVRLFSLIVMQFRRLLIIHIMLNQLYKENEILNKISLPHFLGKKLLAQAKKFSSKELQNIHLELAKLDLNIKYKSSISLLILQDLFQRICLGKFKKI